jgi:hypothetical protein
MGTWIAHIQIAENLWEKIPGLDAEQFVIGNIAPDSGLPDENWESFEPPKTITHYEGKEETKYFCLDLEFYRQFLQDIPWPNKDIMRFSFMLGYFFHLITDNLWGIKIWRPTKKRFLAQFGSETALSNEVKGDWYGLDFIHVRDHPKGFYWKIFMGSKYPQNYLEHFPDEAIPKQMAYIKEFYQRQDEEIQELYNRPYIYLSQAEMDLFIEETTTALLRIYNLIWKENVKLRGLESGLELL